MISNNWIIIQVMFNSFYSKNYLWLKNTSILKQRKGVFTPNIYFNEN